MEVSNLDNLPKLGLTAFYQGKPIAVVFLREVEGGKALIDGLIADPNTHYTDRDKCIGRLINDLLRLAKTHGFTGILALSTHTRTITRAKKLGFTLKPHRLVCIDLNT